MEVLQRLFSGSQEDFPAWHPDYRGAESVVRAEVPGQSLLKGLCLFILLACCGIAGYVEWEFLGIKTKRESLEKQAAVLKPSNTLYLKETQQFLVQERQVELVQGYIAPTQDWLSLLKVVFENKPAEFVFSRVAIFLETPPVPKKGPAPEPTLRIELSGSVRGEPDAALNILQSYRDTILSLPFLDGRIINVDLPSLTRSAKTGLIDFKLNINLKCKAGPVITSDVKQPMPTNTHKKQK